MPYRRLPNTDSARLKALHGAANKTKDISPLNKPFSQATQYNLSNITPKFKSLVKHYKETVSQQRIKTKDYQNKFTKAKNYISHFLQVLNLAIIRGDLKSDIRPLYNLKKDSNKIPRIKTEEDVIKWGVIIQKGENERILRGGNPLTNPTIGVTMIHYEKFLTSYKLQKTLQKNTDRALKEVANIRIDVDNIIVKLWNEIEENFSHLNDINKRNTCREYGIVYFFRRSEEIDMRENVADSYRKNRVMDKAIRKKEERNNQNEETSESNQN